VAAGATLALAGGNTKYLSRTLSNAGTATWAGTGDFSFGGPATFSNSGSLTIQNDQALGGRGVVNNSGTWAKAAGAGTTSVSAAFNNNGTVTLAAGTLQLNGGGTSTGAFDVAAGSSLTFGYPGYTLAAGTTFPGAGVPRVAGGDVYVAGDLTAAAFALDGGTLTGTGDLTVTGAFDWTGGSLTDPNGSLTVAAAATLTIRGPNSKGIDGRTLNLAGTANWSADGGDLSLSNGATVNVLPGGAFNVQADRSVYGNGNAYFSNAGTLTKTSAGTAGLVGGVAFSNDGGAVNVQSGTLRIDDYTQNAGTTDLAAGATLASGGTVNVLGGVLAGVGTVSGTLLNAGEVRPGGSGAPGTLTVNGDYLQAATGALTIEIGGPTAGSEYGRLAVTGTATLGGALTVSLINGYTPNPGDRFSLLTFTAVSGDFAIVDLAGGLLRRTDTATSLDVFAP
jgi:hypothetical protein